MGTFEQFPLLFLGLAFAAGFLGGLTAWLATRERIDPSVDHIGADGYNYIDGVRVPRDDPRIMP